MKKSSSVTLGLLAAVAMVATSGCRKNEVRDCVDQNRRIVDENLCTQPSTYRGGGVMPYYWIYRGATGGHVGDTVVGGSTSPTPGFSSVSRGSVSRGGFGSSFGGIGS